MGNQWIDEAGFTYSAGFSEMTGWNNIPDAPSSEPGTDYWFLGMQNNGDGPVNILQPVLTYSGSEWTAASWACRPSNITTTGPTIGPFREGDQMYGAMTRTNGYTWKIDTVINGQTSTLNAASCHKKLSFLIRSNCMTTVEALSIHLGTPLVEPCAAAKPQFWMRTQFLFNMVVLQPRRLPLMDRRQPRNPLWCKILTSIIIQNDGCYSFTSALCGFVGRK